MSREIGNEERLLYVDELNILPPDHLAALQLRLIRRQITIKEEIRKVKRLITQIPKTYSKLFPNKREITDEQARATREAQANLTYLQETLEIEKPYTQLVSRVAAERKVNTRGIQGDDPELQITDEDLAKVIRFIENRGDVHLRKQ